MNALAHYYAAAASAFHEIFYKKFPEIFFAELFRKSTVIFLEISGKIPQEISGNFGTHNPNRKPISQLRFDYDTTTIRLRRIARLLSFDAIRREMKIKCQFFVVVMS